ncbi:uncharacterized protein [Physcomitrium patens]|uniref:uncharacterized protein n=1 Tax=Physcomitrium patens TaxID=3218 RepID=UPI003CCD0970
MRLLACLLNEGKGKEGQAGGGGFRERERERGRELLSLRLSNVQPSEESRIAFHLRHFDSLMRTLESPWVRHRSSYTECVVKDFGLCSAARLTQFHATANC